MNLSFSDLRVTQQVGFWHKYEKTQNRFFFDSLPCSPEPLFNRNATTIFGFLKKIDLGIVSEKVSDKVYLLIIL